MVLCCILRISRALILLPFLLGACISEGGERRDDSFKALFVSHRWFDLRELMQPVSDDLFYEGAIASAFNNPEQAQTDLKQVIESSADLKQAYQAHQLLRYLFLREGRHGRVLREIKELLAAKPNDPDAQNDRALFEVLSQYPDQEVVEVHSFHTQTPDGKLSVPLLVNGVPARYALDTGANLSVICESEARRLHLVVHDVAGKLYDSTGSASGFRIAVAEHLTIGTSRFRNVAFLVVRDDQQPFLDLPIRERGLIGLPILIALKTMRWTKKETLELGFSSSQRRMQQPNLCFDEAALITKLTVEGQRFDVVLDTGAEKTEFWPQFSMKFTKLLPQGRKAATRETGVTQSVEYDAMVLPRLSIHLGGAQVDLHQTRVLLNRTDGWTQWYGGNLGLDAFHEVHSVTLDFASMTLTLE